jgi:hypothetical protein
MLRTRDRASWASRVLAVASLSILVVAPALARADGAPVPPSRGHAPAASERREGPSARRTEATAKPPSPSQDAPAAPPTAPASSPPAASSDATPAPPAPEPTAAELAARRAAIAECQQSAVVVETAAMATQTELRAARGAGDGARAACLTDLLSQLHASARGARVLVASATDAAHRGDASHVALERGRLLVLGERAARLRTAALACGKR